MENDYLRQKIWEEILDRNLCGADEETGNRPCDDGMICFKCEDKFWQDLYEKKCLEAGIY